MKTLLTLFVLLFSSSVVALEQIIYCSEIDSTGFIKNSNTYDQVPFNEGRYIVKVDFDKNYLRSDDLLIDTKLPGHFCSKDWKDRFMQCINGLGYSFTINMNDYKFSYSINMGYIYPGGTEDSLSISYGKCTSF